MNRIAKILTAAVVTLLMSFCGYQALAMVMDDMHVATMQHSDASCLNQCLASASQSPLLPATQQTIQLFLTFLVQIAPLLLLVPLTISLSYFASRPRPSPNIVKLNVSYLD
ncbi:hypothetical protein HJC99_03870 [Candidatus Saccharibacteria bacterium]|nr:hypothetical protein [Candidatus Saccharibacteria bacterium]